MEEVCSMEKRKRNSNEAIKNDVPPMKEGERIGLYEE
jgi:hypothetical protein